MLSAEALKILLPEKECANPTPRGTMGSIRPETYDGKKRAQRQLMH